MPERRWCVAGRGRGLFAIEVDDGSGFRPATAAEVDAALRQRELYFKMVERADDASVSRLPPPRGQHAGLPHAPEDVTTIGKGVVVKGDVKGGEDLVIDGKVEMARSTGRSSCGNMS